MHVPYRVILLLTGLFIIIQSAYSQEIEEDLASDSVLYKKTVSGGVIAHTLGFGIKFQKGQNKNAFKSFFYEGQFVSMKSPKQIKIVNPYFTNAKSYVYGKINDVYMLRVGVGQNNLLNRKPYWGGAELRYMYVGGISIGLAKPVYLYILNFTSSSNILEYEIITERYDPDIHFYDNIYGRAPFTKGLDGIKFYPGIFGKAGLSFDIGAYKSKINCIEVGGIIEYYPKGIPIMAFNDPKNIFLTLYISYSFGKRYNKY